MDTFGVLGELAREQAGELLGGADRVRYMGSASALAGREVKAVHGLGSLSL